MRPILLLPLLAACTLDDDKFDPDLELGDADLPERAACSDTTFHAWSADGDTVLTVAMPELLLDHPIGDGLHQELDLCVGDAGLAVTVEVGDDLFRNLCTDGLVAIDIEQTWTAVAGEVHVVVDWSDTSDEVRGAVALTGVVLEDDAGDTAVVDVMIDETIVRNWGG